MLCTCVASEDPGAHAGLQALRCVVGQRDTGPMRAGVTRGACRRAEAAVGRSTSTTTRACHAGLRVSSAAYSVWVAVAAATAAAAIATAWGARCTGELGGSRSRCTVCWFDLAPVARVACCVHIHTQSEQQEQAEG